MTNQEIKNVYIVYRDEYFGGSNIIYITTSLADANEKVKECNLHLNEAKNKLEQIGEDAFDELFVQKKLSQKQWKEGMFNGEYTIRFWNGIEETKI